MMRAMIAAVSVVIMASCGAAAQQSSDPRVADLVSAGKLRAGVGVVAPHWAVKDLGTGQLRGVAVEVARALAARIGTELSFVEYPSPPAVLNGLNANAWDVGFLASDPSRASVVDFSPPYLQIDATYLVPAGSSIKDVTEIDRPGVRIVVTTNSVEHIILRRVLNAAEMQAVETIPTAFELVRSGNADALAAPRPALLPLSSRLPGSRVLGGRFHTAFGAIAVPKGHAGRLSFITDFVEEAKASGIIQQAIERAGAQRVQVGPPRTASPQ